jgi:membrane protease YdiL (CAAX protease family)
VLAVYAVAFLLTVVSSTMLIFAVALARTGGERSHLHTVALEFALSAPGLIVGAGVNSAVLAAVAFSAARLHGRAVGAELRLATSRASPLGALAACAGLVGLSFACGALRELLRVEGTGGMDALADSLHGAPAGRLLAAVLAIGVVPGFAEEAFFRGYMQTRLVASWGRWPAVVVASAAFGLIHLDPVQGSVAFAAGLFLGWVVERLGGLRPSILAHVTNNVIFVVIAGFATSDAAPASRPIAMLAAGSAACGGAILLLRSPRAVRPAPAETPSAHTRPLQRR